MAKKKNSMRSGSSSSKKVKQGDRRNGSPAPRKWLQESVGIFSLAIAAIIILSLYVHLNAKSSEQSAFGSIGRTIATSMTDFLGLTAFLIPLAAGYWGLILFRHRRLERQLARLVGLILMIVFLSTFLSLFISSITLNTKSTLAGGWIGNVITAFIKGYLGDWGSRILFFALILIAFLVATDISFYQFFHFLKATLLNIIHCMSKRLGLFYEKWYERRFLRKQMAAELREMKLEEIKRSKIQPAEDLASDFDDQDDLEFVPKTSEPPIISISRSVTELPVEDDFSEMINENGEDGYPEDDLSFIRTTPIDYQTPPLSLLDEPSPSINIESEEDLISKSKILVSKLADFNIQGRVTEVCPGPVITRYEFEPAPGIKISKITSLADDLALGLKSKGLIRVAPIAGKSTLGVEIPNEKRDLVSLRELIVSEEFKQASPRSTLLLPLGKDIAGRPYIADLKKMPHLLIAGATGSGKSVCINSILCGLLYNATPSQLRLLLIDPKMLELSDYNGIPHLREPVITDVKKAPDALNWAVEEMNRRYEKLASIGARNIDQYNERVTDLKYEGPEMPLPYIIVIIDELADLMLTTPAVVEESIQRLAQMARASGIHLIIATQRPSVDVITGVIKANLPCRLAFQVASRVDSRTILDSIGAEKLLGMGDSLFVPPGTSQIIRLHGAYISDSEIKRLVAYLREQPPPEKEESIFRSFISDKSLMEEGEDPLYDQAVKLVLSSGLASISFLQRRLKVGHSRASRLIDFMELNGIVGPHIGSKTREILVDRDEFLDRMNQVSEEDPYHED